ncbi:alpha/beta hydrolase [Actinocorallia longicatena]|uniref:Alpha/beta hydrolase n=1 Tax=Actinocorallia longicatena TaxID=111803 RepID=A0ABP6Q3J3_9ACTN
MDGRRKRRLGIAGAVAGLGAAGIGAAVAARKIAVGRVRLLPDPDVNEPFGQLRGEPLTVLADDGLALHVEIEQPPGRRPRKQLTIVFCHGYCLTQDTWHYQRRDLAGTRMVFWDQRSHGRSGRSRPSRATIDQTGADLAAVLRATTRPGDPVLLVGHSMGGMSIMALAERSPEFFDRQVIGVGLINTSTGDIHEMTLGLPLILAKVIRPVAPRVVRGLGARKNLIDPARTAGADLAFFVIRRMGFADRNISPTLVDFVERMIRATTIDVIAEFYPALMRHDKRKSLETLTKVPILVMSGGADQLTPRAHGELIADSLDDAEFVGVDQAGHLLPLEHPGLVTAALRRLLARATGRPVEEAAS